MKDSILDVVHNTAKDLSDAGVMDIQTMQQFDALCLPKIEQYDGSKIKAIREKERVSQAVFAAYLNTTPSTVRQWEQGAKRPRGTSLKLLNLVAQKGLEILV
ncbi:MAG: DNA-binding transcriptional regulator [Pseudomonadota bacterium]|uniref:helix-turn-helix domain-containing protein n=1 Tax=unclassified Alteromonas TaxID=2614992 RepID=UPI001922AB97|nr:MULTISPECIES: DNA-binding transcriptional regulator [unclassified Alteromonas]WDT86231.1 DNA-binding transcriptional regulator [Alteromonas sp. 009811495]BCO21201.1 transcriptional regulator [Alteromonas sp. KC14]